MYGIAKAIGAVALAGAMLSTPVALHTGVSHAEPTPRADFRGQTFSPQVQYIADWAVNSRDHQGLPFIIVDKSKAQAVAFDRTGRLLSATPVLVGMGTGDRFAPGVLNLEMHDMQPSERITPSGRFFAEEGFNLSAQHVLWVDYDAAIAIHKIPAKETKQRRHERIVSRDPAQHRITYGCINVPPGFYDHVVHPQFSYRGGIVYVLPDSTPLKSVFKSSYEVRERSLSSTAQAVANPAQIQRF